MALGTGLGAGPCLQEGAVRTFSIPPITSPEVKAWEGEACGVPGELTSPFPKAHGTADGTSRLNQACGALRRQGAG